MILPLAAKVPPSSTPERWSHVVDAMRLVLEGLTGAGLLDLKEMQQLRRDVQLRVDAATPQTAAHGLAELWRELETRAGPVLSQHATLGLGAAVRSLEQVNPPHTEPADWELAMLETRAMLVALGNSEAFSKAGKRQLRERIEAHLAETRPENAVTQLRDVWEIAASTTALPGDFAQPEILNTAP